MIIFSFTLQKYFKWGRGGILIFGYGKIQHKMSRLCQISKSKTVDNINRPLNKQIPSIYKLVFVYVINAFEFFLGRSKDSFYPTTVTVPNTVFVCGRERLYVEREGERGRGRTEDSESVSCPCFGCHVKFI